MEDDDILIYRLMHTDGSMGKKVLFASQIIAWTVVYRAFTHWPTRYTVDWWKIQTNKVAHTIHWKSLMDKSLRTNFSPIRSRLLGVCVWYKIFIHRKYMREPLCTSYGRCSSLFRAPNKIVKSKQLGSSKVQTGAPSDVPYVRMLIRRTKVKPLNTVLSFKQVCI